ncbi:MAG TPA: hypothetical protein ENH10_03565 [Bacteroidetes bacterium]|nr:hypothetical protein [Bacteroidota bacterium]HEX04220.1 hypothetical protein [Bacteroidota bacterium]
MESQSSGTDTHSKHWVVDYPLEIRWHGRGGQGAVTAAKFLAELTVAGGMFVQSFPQFGSERRGAPIQAFTRIDKKMITLYSSIREPDIAIVLDKSLLDLPPTLAGLHENRFLLVNAEVDDEHPLLNAESTQFKVAAVPATRIAMEHLHRPITNTAMLGAFLGVTGMFELEEVCTLLREKHQGLFRPEIVTANINAVSDAWHQVRQIN